MVKTSRPGADRRAESRQNLTSTQTSLNKRLRDYQRKNDETRDGTSKTKA
ncbi:predicted protein [Arabidopsis lyrata subsp. lyrata]|uniref:Predicted protein n=1 Tax=Arabidopsis lyrata subsp. lyrata TaxID=81972 RepID=D7KFI1_ARALL|nr:predicted protein [Arabidopsis lyrata subsp. lyrata]